MEKYAYLISIGFAAWAITAASAPPCAARERPAVGHEIEAWVKSYRRGLPEPPAETTPKTHLPQSGKSIGQPPPEPEGDDATRAQPDIRLPAGSGRTPLSQGGER